MSDASYYLYKKQFSYDGTNWFDVQPLTYSYDGDGTMQPVVNTYHDEDCKDNVDYSKQYLTIESLEDNNVIYWKASQLDANYPPTPKTISASTDNGVTWTEYTSSTGGSGTTIATLNANDKLLLKGENTNYSNNAPNLFKATGEFEVYGNIMSLISGNSFESAELTIAYAFHGIFSGCTGLTSAENLILPATTLRPYCYQSMFDGCTNLTTAPELPSLNLSYMCYAYMFNGCTRLTTAPELPATTLASTCYYYMFNGCTSLTVAPELPATTLVYMCYQSMFEGCTSLTTAPELPATTLAGYCYYYMFNGCTSLTTAPELSATTLANSCYRGMFQNCTSLTTAPELPATTLETNCYWYMFNSCTNLNYIKCLATTFGNGSTYRWVQGVSSTGTFVKDTNTTWSTGTSGIPSGWTVQNA